MTATTISPKATKCLRCGRVLRSASAVAAGYGRTCATKIRKSAQTSPAKPDQIAKAVELIEVGAIVPVKGRRVFRVVNSKGDSTYLSAATGQCTCPAGLRCRPCYHAAAAAILNAA